MSLHLHWGILNATHTAKSNTLLSFVSRCSGLQATIAKVQCCVKCRRCRSPFEEPYLEQEVRLVAHIPNCRLSRAPHRNMFHSWHMARVTRSEPWVFGGTWQQGEHADISFWSNNDTVRKNMSNVEQTFRVITSSLIVIMSTFCLMLYGVTFATAHNKGRRVECWMTRIL